MRKYFFYIFQVYAFTHMISWFWQTKRWNTYLIYLSKQGQECLGAFVLFVCWHTVWNNEKISNVLDKMSVNFIINNHVHTVVNVEWYRITSLTRDDD